MDIMKKRIRSKTPEKKVELAGAVLFSLFLKRQGVANVFFRIAYVYELVHRDFFGGFH
ncbi:MAG TPA: hypothetical protein P5346_08680 [Spirochaetota bacterium]|nr:hypothetical protein [Spirochaetota bacterium]HSA14804.1 hypothetical protein [Spirochaetota bacterium]